MRRLAPLVLLLAACAPGPDPDAVIRASERVANEVLQRAYPDLFFYDPVVACIRANATVQELEILAGYEGSSGTGQAQRLVQALIARPDTDACLRGQGITFS